MNGDMFVSLVQEMNPMIRLRALISSIKGLALADLKDSEGSSSLAHYARVYSNTRGHTLLEAANARLSSIRVRLRRSA